MRKKIAADNSGNLKEKGYRILLREKENYIFQNYRHITNGTVLFPGCNFPSFYPETTRKLWKVLQEYQDVGIVYDCCGKPLEELGKEAQAEKIVRSINQKLKQAGVDEVIMVCPNCYYYLKDRLEVKVISVYEKLAKLGAGQPAAGGDVHMFIPCPDRKEREWLTQMEVFLPAGYSVIEGVQCCGLGGCAAVKEADLAKGFAEVLKEKQLPNLYTYCGTCGGNITRAGVNGVNHILAGILETEEAADVKKSLLNRAKTKFI